MIDKMKVYKDTEISNKAVLVYLYLCDRANKKDQSWDVYKRQRHGRILLK